MAAARTRCRTYTLSAAFHHPASSDSSAWRSIRVCSIAASTAAGVARADPPERERQATGEPLDRLLVLLERAEPFEPAEGGPLDQRGVAAPGACDELPARSRSEATEDARQGPLHGACALPEDGRNHV